MNEVKWATLTNRPDARRHSASARLHRRSSATSAYDPKADVDLIGLACGGGLSRTMGVSEVPLLCLRVMKVFRYAALFGVGWIGTGVPFLAISPSLLDNLQRQKPL